LDENDDKGGKRTIASDLSKVPDAVWDEAPESDGAARPCGVSDVTGLEVVEQMVRGQMQRYEVGSWRTKGGMGEVEEVLDLLLGRRVVRKRPLRGNRNEPGWLAFVHEAQVTAELSHPAIVPLLDLRMDLQGFYYLMPLVAGTNLREVLKGLANGDDGLRRRFGLRRLLHVFRTVCGAVAHAHDRGIVHRDIKPDQILLGRHDEVLLTDWGLAARLGGTVDPLPAGSGTALSASSVRSGQTVLEGMHGGPQYQPPERLTPGKVPAEFTQDVYSLGAVLYHVLTLHAPVDEPRDPGLRRDDLAYMAFLQRQISRLSPPSSRPWGAPLDPVWDEICQRCLAVMPVDRYPDAGALYRDVEQALSEFEEARRRRARATEALAAGERAEEELVAAARSLEEARRLRRELEARITPQQPLGAKRPLWEAEDLEQRAEREHAERFAAAEREYGLALSIDPASGEARARLSDLYLRRAEEARQAGDEAGRAYNLERLRAYDDGTRAERLSRPVWLTVECEPDGAEVRLAPLIERDRRLLAGDWQELGKAPLVSRELDGGRYTLEIAAHGRMTARYALRLEPGDALTLAPNLPALADVPEPFVYVPAGPAWIGGDPMVAGTGPRRSVHLPDFAIGAFPVTLQQYRRFLDALPRETAHQRVPRDPVDGQPLLRVDGDGWSIPPEDHHGDPVTPDMPVLLVRAVDAEAYATWASGRDGRTYRLPVRDEWEYAARGSDGRYFPWGDRYEATYAWGRDQQAGKPLPAPVGRCAEDRSVVGARDLAGGVGDWLADPYSEDGAKRHVGGGSWFASAGMARLARRFGFDPSQRSAGLGFRLVLEL